MAWWSLLTSFTVRAPGPQQERVSAGLCLGKKAQRAGAPKKQGNSEAELTRFSRQEGFSSTAPPNPVSHQPREMDSVKESCTSAGALGGAPLLVEVGSRGSKRSLMPRRVRWPDGGRGPPARPRRCPHSPSRPSVRSSSGPALPSSPSTATSSSSSSPEVPRPGEGWVSWGLLFFGRLTPIPPRPRGSGLPVLAAGRFLTSCLTHLAGSRWSSAFRPHAPRSR